VIIFLGVVSLVKTRREETGLVVLLLLLEERNRGLKKWID
jgi:hypothetical protein